MSDTADECDHDWEEQETGPIDYAGHTRIYAVCSECGEDRYIGPGSGVL